MDKFITDHDRELLPWLHCSPIVKTIEQSLISTIKLGFARESIKIKLEAVASAALTGIFNDEVKFIERKILALIKDHDEAPATITLIKKTLLKLEKPKLQNKERELVTKQDQIKTELDNKLEALIAKRHPQYHHPRGLWTDADATVYLRFTSAYQDIITATYDHRQLLHLEQKKLKKLAYDKKQEEDNALLQLTRKDLNQTIAASIKAFSKSLTNKSSSNKPKGSKNGLRPAQKAGRNTKQVAKSNGKIKEAKRTKQTLRKNKKSTGGVTRK